MLTKQEFAEYKEKVTSEQTMKIITGDSADEISKLEAELSIYYARVGFEFARIKDLIDKRIMELINQEMAVNKATITAEIEVNAESEVSRREMDYLHKALDKLGFTCSHRLKMLVAEGIKANTEEGF